MPSSGQRLKDPGPLQPRPAMPAKHSAQRTSDDQRNGSGRGTRLSGSRNSGHSRSPQACRPALRLRAFWRDAGSGRGGGSALGWLPEWEP